MVANNWNEWQNHVLAELKRLNTNVEHIKDKNEEDHRELFTGLATLKVKARMWGAIAGAIPGCLVLIWYLIDYLNGN